MDDGWHAPVRTRWSSTRRIMWRLLCFLLLAMMLVWCLGPIYTTLLLLPPFLLCWARGRWKRRSRIDLAGRAVFITGCDTGFGNMLSRRLHRMGVCVFAGCLFPDGLEALDLKHDCDKAEGTGELHIIKLNVCRDDDIERAEDYVLNHLPEKGLWALVNNAGISAWGSTDWLSLEKYKHVVDVNLMGSIRTTLIFLPLIRQQKGRMVFMSSMGAFVAAKNGIYSMTKAALEKFCDSLRLDMKMFGVKVCIIEPGNYAATTAIQPQRTGEEIWNELSEELQETYSKAYVTHLANFTNAKLSQGHKNPNEVIDAIVDALTSANPRARYLVGSMTEKIAVFFFSVCPTSWSDALLLSLLK